MHAFDGQTDTRTDRQTLVLARWHSMQRGKTVLAVDDVAYTFAKTKKKS